TWPGGRSAVESAPVRWAVCVPWPGMATRIVPPPSTTWALVRTWPAGVRIMPVPAPRPRPDPEVMATTAGSTWATTARTLMGPAGADPVDGAAIDVLMTGEAVRVVRLARMATAVAP